MAYGATCGALSEALFVEAWAGGAVAVAPSKTVDAPMISKSSPTIASLASASSASCK